MNKRISSLKITFCEVNVMIDALRCLRTAIAESKLGMILLLDESSHFEE